VEHFEVRVREFSKARSLKCGKSLLAVFTMPKTLITLVFDPSAPLLDPDAVVRGRKSLFRDTGVATSTLEIILDAV